MSEPKVRGVAAESWGQGMSAPVGCSGERRRAKARAAGANGIDGITVSEDQRTLSVLLFGKAPRGLRPVNFRIDGGRRITGIEVVNVAECLDEDPEFEDCVRLTVDRPGDFSTYRLSVVRADPRGRPGVEPYPGFDPRYACLDFSFKQNCSNAVLDCAADDACPPAVYTEPEIDYLAKDYASFRQLLLDRLSLTMPGWTERHVPDLGMTLVELLSYAGDQLSYHQDAVATEAYLETARRRISVRRHVRLVDYAMHDGCSARAFVCVETAGRLILPAGDFRFASIDQGLLPAGGPALLESDLAAARVDPAAYEVFEPVHAEDVVLRKEHNRISLWTWGDENCSLPEGATAATLVDGAPGEAGGARALRLAPGDVLVFEEIRGAGTGAEADADPTHRQAVRLTSVTRGVDALYDQPVVEVTWAAQDALTFPLCVRARAGADCVDMEIGVARGNVVLVEHGRDRTWCGGEPEIIGVPAAEPDEPGCPDPPEFGCPDESRPAHRPAYPPLTRRFTPALRHAPVTQHAPFPAAADIAEAQARHLLGLPERIRDRLHALWRAADRDEKLTDDGVAFLTLLFGESTLRTVELREHPRRALRHLLARFDELLERKLSRLAELVRRARSGYVLGAEDEGWELAQTWGSGEGAAVDPAHPAFRGPAALALRPDPRAALPAVQVTVDGDEGPAWLPRRDLLDSGPAGRHFVGELDDDGTLRLRFGDRTAGAVPPAGSTLRVSYRTGTGGAGNVGGEAINRIVFGTTRQDGIGRVRNPLPAAGGTDPEPVPEVRSRAPQQPRHLLLRAVTPADYAALAETVPAVQRAAGDLRWTGSWYEARVAVDPLGAGVAPDRLLDEVRETLHLFRRVGHDLAVVTARLVPLDLALEIGVEPDHITGHVKQAVARALGAGRLPGGGLGLFHPDNLTFGTPVRVSRIVGVAAAVPGVRHVEVTRLRRLFGPPDEAREAGVLRLRPLEVAQLDNDPADPESGMLTLDMRGGR